MKLNNWIVYVDETIISSNTIQEKIFTAQGEHLHVVRKDVVFKPIYVMAAISKDHGVKAILIQRYSYNSIRFC